MAGKCGAICGSHQSAGGVVAEHHDEQRVEYLYGIFETCDDFIAGEIARDAANETSSRAVSKQYSGAIREVAQTTECVCPAGIALKLSLWWK
jgi:hypothetical protein